MYKKILGIVSLVISLPLSYLLCGAYQRITAHVIEDDFIDNTAKVQNYLFAQILFITVICIIGFCIVQMFHASRFWSFVLIFPVGLSFVYIVSMLLLMLSIPYNAVTLTGSVLVCLIIVAAISLILRAQKRKNGRTSSPEKESAPLTQWAFVLALHIMAATFCCMVPFRSIISDSVNYYLMNGSLIARFGQLPYFQPSFTLTVGQLLPVICSWPLLFGFRQPFGIQYMLVLSMYGYMVYYAMRQMKPITKKRVLIIIGAVVLLIALQPVVLTNTAWLLSNAYTMVFLCLCVALASKICQTVGTTAEWVALGLFSVCLCAGRAEGLFYSILLAGVMVTSQAPSFKVITAVLVPPFILQAMLYINVFFVHANAYGFHRLVTPFRAGLTLGASIGVMFYFAFLRNRPAKFLQKIRINFNAVMLLGLIVVYVGAFMLNIAMNKTSLVAILQNLFTYDVWATTSMLIIVGVLCVLVYNRLKLDLPMTFVLSYAVFSMLLFAMRSSLRVSPYDSGNRVFMQLVPTVYLIFIDFFLTKNKQTDVADSAPSPV